MQVLNLNAVQALLREKQSDDPVVQQVADNQVAEEPGKKRPPPLPRVPTELLERLARRRQRRQMLAERGLLAGGRPDNDEIDDDDFDDEDETAFVDIDANYEVDIARLIANALKKDGQMADAAASSDEESVIIEPDPDDREWLLKPRKSSFIQ